MPEPCKTLAEALVALQAQLPRIPCDDHGPLDTCEHCRPPVEHNYEYGREHDGYSHRGIPPACPACAACPVCRQPIEEHIGRKPCTISPPSTAKTIYDLPIAAWAWKEDGRDRRA